MGQKETLYPREWLLFWFIVSLFSALIFIAAAFSRQVFFEKAPDFVGGSKKIFIYVEGAVAKPIIIESHSPVSFKHILEQVELKKNADLGFYSKRRKFSHSASIFIPEKDEE